VYAIVIEKHGLFGYQGRTVDKRMAGDEQYEMQADRTNKGTDLRTKGYLHQ
jgi:hypothetical protein